MVAVFAASWFYVITAKAEGLSNNKVMKYCLDATGYKPENLATFNFSEASNCYHGWKVQNEQEKAKERQAFLKEHPWYRGPKWQWEETAEYNCEKIYSTAYLNNITICTKPYYIN